MKNNFITGKQNWERKLWLWIVFIYAMAEGVYWFSQYFFTDLNPHLAAYYIFQGLLHIIITVALCFALSRIRYNISWIAFAIHLCAFFAYYFLWLFIKYYLHNKAPLWLNGSINRNYPIKNIIYDSWFDIGNYVLVITAFYVLTFYVKFKKAAEQHIQLTMLNKDMQLNLLKQQLNPHFYFNTLNNLYGLAQKNSRKLSPALQQLHNIMEYVIVECDRNKVSLQKEIDFLKSYIALEQLRYEENTVIDVRVKGNADGNTILPLLLIQFVENAFKHGMKEKSEMNWMQVDIQTKDDELFFSVNNSCHGGTFTEGVGLCSVKHRLNLQYDKKYNMQISNADNKFSVLLQLNLL